MAEKQPLKQLNVSNDTQVQQKLVNLQVGKREKVFDDTTMDNAVNIENRAPREECVKKPISKSSQPALGSEPEKEQIRNVDANDHEKPQYCSLYVDDIVAHYLAAESQFLVPENYLDGRPVSRRHRGILIDRMVSLHSRFQCAPEVFHVLVNLIDRYIYAKPELTKTSLHLVGVTCLLIASKIEEITSPILEDLVVVTDGECPSGEILHMERNIMTTLDFRLLVPHALLFLRRFSKVAGATPKVHMISKYAIELAQVEMLVVHVKPSKVAAAALLMSMKIVDRFSTWDTTMQHHSRYQKEDLVDLAKAMYNLIRNVKSSSNKLKATYHKYANRRCNRIADLPELSNFRVDILDQ